MCVLDSFKLALLLVVIFFITNAIMTVCLKHHKASYIKKHYVNITEKEKASYIDKYVKRKRLNTYIVSALIAYFSIPTLSIKSYGYGIMWRILTVAIASTVIYWIDKEIEKYV